MRLWEAGIELLLGWLVMHSGSRCVSLKACNGRAEREANAKVLSMVEKGYGAQDVGVELGVAGVVRVVSWSQEAGVIGSDNSPCNQMRMSCSLIGNQ